jgi:hypothetical protein
MRIPIGTGDASDQSRSAGGEQLDDGIVGTLVSVLLLTGARHKGCRGILPGLNEEISDRIPPNIGAPGATRRHLNLG